MTQSATSSPKSEYIYDNAYNGQLDATKAYDSNGTTVAVETQILTRDNRYRVTTQQWLVNGAGSFKMAFGYDAANYQTSIQYPADNNGNLGETVSQNYNSDQPHAVTAAHGNQYCYDGNANQVSRLIDGTLYSLTYDSENRLTGVSQVSNLTATIAQSGDDVQLS